MELRERRPLCSRRRAVVLFRALVRAPRRGRLAIQMIDEPRVERELTLQIGRHRSPDEAGETATPACAVRRRAGTMSHASLSAASCGSSSAAAGRMATRRVPGSARSSAVSASL